MITSIEQATPQWLTRQLRNVGCLEHGQVVAVQIIKNAAFNSQAAHLVLHYATGAAEAAPQRLFLKLKGNHDGALEVAFYHLAENYRGSLPMLVHCWGAAYDTESGDAY